MADKNDQISPGGWWRMWIWREIRYGGWGILAKPALQDSC